MAAPGAASVGEWRCSADSAPRTATGTSKCGTSAGSRWYRIRYLGGLYLDKASLATVERVLRENAGYEIADLTEDWSAPDETRVDVADTLRVGQVPALAASGSRTVAGSEACTSPICFQCP